MDNYSIAAILLGISGLFTVFNTKILRLPESIGLMATGLIASIAVLLVGNLVPEFIQPLCEQVETLDFSYIVLTVALGFLMFAGAYEADGATMSRERWPIIVFATVGILLSTFLVGGMTFGIVRLIGLENVSFIHCLLFGALISPTDPIAVLAILKKTAVPPSLQADIAGESLLNDGVAVVVFLTLLELAGASHAASVFGPLDILTLFGREVIGGLILGAAFGWLAITLVRLTRSASGDILITVATVMSAYALAAKVHVSGPLALVVTGLMLGHQMHRPNVDPDERLHLDYFWSAIDHLFNALIFTLMGVVLLSLSQHFDSRFLVAGLLAIPIVLLARVISVAIPLPFTKLRCGNRRNTIALLTWGGLRGGISMALALSLQPELSRSLILHLTYAVVIFSILVQGLTISPLVKRLAP